LLRSNHSDLSIASEFFTDDYVAASGFANRTVRSNLVAVYNLLAGLLTAAPVPASIARRLQLPALNHPVLAAESVAWRASHLFE